MHRRTFMLGTGAAASLSVIGEAAKARTRQTQSRRPATPPAATQYRMKLGCQSMPSTDAHFEVFARYGVRNISARATVADGRMYPTVAELTTLKQMAERHGLSLDMLEPEILNSTHIDREKHPGIMLGRDPDREREIEAFATTLRNCAAVGIPCVKYNMSLLGVLRTAPVEGRGGSKYFGWDLANAKPATPLTRAGRVDATEFWKRITYFLDRIVPIANETKVRIACHPQDPGTPPGGYQGIDNVLGTIEGLKRFVLLNESPYHGLNFCQGSVCENLTDPANQIFDVIRWFGERKKIFNVHFRNIHGARNRFNETFPDEGDIDMVRALRTYAEVGYDGMIMPDHVPGMDDPLVVDGKPVWTPRAENFAFCYGYIRGLLQSAQRSA
ncbi:mannonate dehydratase [Sphingomonas sp. LB2R24]|uniref:mannonate dehydratase n=1 Tax=Sphingomonas sorbitolis TaxID=3096165 RepID=UPI002FCB41B2